jgi:hypothetical protein
VSHIPHILRIPHISYIPHLSRISRIPHLSRISRGSRGWSSAPALSSSTLEEMVGRLSGDDE